MRLILLNGQGSVGKSYIAKKLIPLLHANDETVQYICMDRIVGQDMLGEQHWNLYNSLLTSSVRSAYDNILVDFSVVEYLCGDVFCRWDEETCSNVDVFLFQLYPTSVETILENTRTRFLHTDRGVTDEFEFQIREAYLSTRIVSEESFKRFGFRSVNTYVLREQDTYLSDIMNVLFDGSYEGDDN